MFELQKCLHQADLIFIDHWQMFEVIISIAVCKSQASIPSGVCLVACSEARGFFIEGQEVLQVQVQVRIFINESGIVFTRSPKFLQIPPRECIMAALSWPVFSMSTANATAFLHLNNAAPHKFIPSNEVMFNFIS